MNVICLARVLAQDLRRRIFGLVPVLLAAGVMKKVERSEKVSLSLSLYPPPSCSLFLSLTLSISPSLSPALSLSLSLSLSLLCFRVDKSITGETWNI